MALMDEEPTNKDGLTFTHWRARVDRIVLGICGLTTDDLGDYPAWDLWDSCVSPREAAEECLVVWNDFDPDDLN